MTAYTIDQLIALGTTAQTYFEKELGYDRAQFDHVRLRTGGDHKLEFELFDEFQKNLPHDMKHKVGWSVDVPLENFWNKLTAWPNREQRELVVLSRKMALIDGNLDDIESAQVRAFVERMQPDIDALRAQITDQTSDTVEVT